MGLHDDNFLSAYLDKGRVSSLLEKVPLFFVKSDDMGERGAHFRAVQLLKEREARKGAADRFAIQRFDSSSLPRPRDLVAADILHDGSVDDQVIHHALKTCSQKTEILPSGES